MLVPDILHEPQEVRKKIRGSFAFSLSEGCFLIPSLFKESAIICWIDEGLYYGGVDFSASMVKPIYQQLLWEVCSSSYIRPLEKITQCSGLIPDTFFMGGGVFLFDDVNKTNTQYHPKTGLLKRLHHCLFLENMMIVIKGDEYQIKRGDVLLLDSLLVGIESLSNNDNKPVFYSCYYENK